MLGVGRRGGLDTVAVGRRGGLETGDVWRWEGEGWRAGRDPYYPRGSQPTGEVDCGETSICMKIEGTDTSSSPSFKKLVEGIGDKITVCVHTVCVSISLGWKITRP